MIKQKNSKYNRAKNPTAGNAIPTDNFIYFHHTGKSITIPVDPQALTDSMSASWVSSSPLSRSAPIYSYQNSGPRSMQFSFQLHRDLVKQFNPDWKEDPVDALITNLEACVLPTYKETGKIVNPPIVSVKIRDEVYIKGVVNNVTKSFNLPLIYYANATPPGYKYALVDLGFAVSEITPQDASIIKNIGGFRG